MSHFLLMALYAALVGCFFSLLWRQEMRERVKLFLQIFLSMVGGGMALAWLMYFFPGGPPAPIP